jgi:Flp pilus assembly protein TadB
MSARQPNHPQQRPPRSLSEIERVAREKTKAGRFQFSLGRLLLVSNVLGLVVAVIVISRGVVVQVALLVSVLSMFFAPLLVAIYFAVDQTLRPLFQRPRTRLGSKRQTPKPLDSPFDEP